MDHLIPTIATTAAAAANAVSSPSPSRHAENGSDRDGSGVADDDLVRMEESSRRTVLATKTVSADEATAQRGQQSLPSPPHRDCSTWQYVWNEMW